MSSPKKRKLVNETDPSEELIYDINAEVDLEIALRRQLIQTLEGRVAWGVLLQESIRNGNGSASQETFRNVAMDALLSLETSSHCILSQDPIPPSSTSTRTARPSPRKICPPNFKPKPSFLYTRSNPAVQQEGNHSHLYILRCPGCSKTTFTSLQGLLNHARLTHSLEWGTHDACIRACAVLDNDLDEEAGVEVGTGPTGVLPGLQTIFQMAIGGQSRGNGGVVQNAEKGARKNSSSTDGSHLNQTLGLHEDSPSLAPFLGKEAIRRQIKVWDEDADIDLGSSQRTSSREIQRPKRPWKISFAPRNLAEPLILEFEHHTDNSTPAENVNNDKKYSDTKYSASLTAPIIAEGLAPRESRFRFIARIVITDRSLLIPEDQRSNERQDFTHKWMISVDAPSYANHITSILNGIRVTPSDSTLSMPIPSPTTTPPFVVVGVSNGSFLARVELSFSGTSSDPKNQDQKVLFEHWVDLDPIEGRGVVTGQDQVLDVELDKNTVLKPSKLGYVPIDSKSHWNQTVTPGYRSEAKVESQAVDENTSAISTTILTKFSKRFPMTAGSRPPNHIIPYRLVASPSYFKTLVMGRRKAIEWGRARAIQAAYNEEIQTVESPTLLPLTVARVYSWLSENNHFIKVTEGTQRAIKQENYETTAKEEEDSNAFREPKESKHWCRICGMHPSVHLIYNDVKLESLDNEEPKPKMIGIQNQTHSILSSDDSCTIVPRVLQIAKLPKINIQRLVGDGKERLDRKNAGPVVASPHTLVSVANPHLILYIRRLVENLSLSRFRPLMKFVDDGQRFSHPLGELGRCRSDVEKNLAPYALLALVTKSFVRVLVERGLEVANRDKVLSTGLSSSKRPRGNRRVNEIISKTGRMLTPTHILSGILTRGRGRGSSQDPLDTVVLLCLSKLGVTADTEPFAPSRQGELEPLVKSEEL